MRLEPVRRHDGTRARRPRTSLVLGHIIGRVGVRQRRPQLQRGLGADGGSGPSGASQGGNDTCGQKTCQRGRFSPSTPALRCGFTLEGPPTRYVPRCSAESGLSNTVLMWVSSASAIRTPAPTPSHGRTPLVPRAPSTTAEATSPAVTGRSHQGSNLAPSSSARLTGARGFCGERCGTALARHASPWHHSVYGSRW